MKVIIFRIILIFLLSLGISGTVLAEDRYFVGLQSLKTKYAEEVLPIRIFYPTLDEEHPEKFGPWELSVAKNAKPAGGRRAVVFISHGLGGNKWNHHLLASELARAGLVAVSFDHADDWLRVGHKEHLTLRPGELQKVIHHVLNANEVMPALDQNRLGVFGFSLGGFTALSAAGARHDYARIQQHCEAPEKDPNYCAVPDVFSALPLRIKLQRFYYKLPKLDDERIEPVDFKAMVLAAPLAQPFVEVDDVNAELMLIRAGDDQELRYPYHAQYLHNLLDEAHQYIEVEDIHHYAFLSPFPKSIRQEVGEPAIDKAGFDREEFLKSMNAEIRDFYLLHLSQ